MLLCFQYILNQSFASFASPNILKWDLTYFFCADIFPFQRMITAKQITGGIFIFAFIQQLIQCNAS